MSGKKYFKRYTEKRDERLRHDFLPEALEIVERPASPVGNFVIVTIALLLATAIIWSVFGKVDVVATSRGIVLTVSGVQTIQPSEGGMVTDIYVAEGQRVQKGERLLQLDASINRIGAKTTEKMLNLTVYRNDLLNRLLAGEDISGELENETDGDKRVILASLVALRQNHELEMNQARTAISQQQGLVAVEKEKMTMLNEQIALYREKKARLNRVNGMDGPENLMQDKIRKQIEEQEKRVEEYKKLKLADAITGADLRAEEDKLALLYKDLEIQSVTAVYEIENSEQELLQINNNISAAMSELTNQQANVAIAEQELEKSQQASESIREEFITVVTNQIIQNDSVINEQGGNLEAQEIQYQNQVLVSPVDGVVKTVDVNTVGGVLLSAQTAMTIVPDDNQLIVEADVLNSDIGYIELNGDVAVKLDTYSYQRYGKLNGRVVYISPDAILDEQKGWIYKIRVAIDSEDFYNKNSENVEITTGMVCTVEVKTGKRRIISFFLEPIVDHFDTSLNVR